MSVTPSILYNSKVRTTAALSNQPKKKFPLPQNSQIQLAAYAFDQEMEMAASSFPPAPKNTVSSATSRGSAIFPGLLDANAVLTNLSQPTPTMGGLVKFAASFAIVPASWDDFKTVTVTFPGWINLAASGLARPAFSEVVNIRMHYDYFLVDPTGIAGSILDSSGNAVSVVTSMGSIKAFVWPRWLNMLIVSTVLTPEQNSKVNDLVPTGGVTVGTNTYEQTFPSATQYQAWCATATAFIATGTAWDSTHPPVFTPSFSSSPWGTTGSEGQYEFTDSTLKVYAGQIIERCRYFVMPK